MKKFAWLLVAAALVVSLACKRESSKVSNEMETARKIAKLEQDINGRQDQMNQLLQKYMQEGGKDVGLEGAERVLVLGGHPVEGRQVGFHEGVEVEVGAAVLGEDGATQKARNVRRVVWVGRQLLLAGEPPLAARDALKERVFDEENLNVRREGARSGCS